MDYKSTLMYKEINETPKIFEDLYSVNEEAIEFITDNMARRGIRNIYAVARGTSDHALIFFKYVAEILIGIPVTLGAASVITLYNGKLDLSHSLVLGCSQSGAAEDVLEVIKRCNEQSGLSVALTNNKNSALAKTAQYHLYCNAGEEKSVAATKTYNCQNFILLQLAFKICARTGGLKGLQNLYKALRNCLPELERQTDVLAEKYSYVKSGFILSRGITYALALEASLKLQETCYIEAKGYASSDFYHGPMAMVNSDTFVMIYASDSRSEEGTGDRFLRDEAKCIEKMRELGAKIVLVTDSPYLCAQYSGIIDVVSIPDFGSGFFTMFGFSFVAQLFACKISCKIGNNPDKPRALSKITITR